MDLRFALRSLRKNPGFALLAVLIVALGVGANTAVFSVVNAVLLKPLDYHDSERIVTLSTLWKESGNHGQVSAPDFHDWHNQSTAFSAMACYFDYPTAMQSGGTAEYVHAAGVGPEFFQVFAIEPAMGRLFSPEEEKPGSAGAALISYSYWQSHFGANANAMGQALRLMGKSFVVAGVLPARFHYPNGTDIWLPANAVFEEIAERSAHNYRVVGKLKPDVGLEQAQAQMTAIGTRLGQQYPDSDRGKSVAVFRMRDEMVRNIRLTLYLLLGAVTLVLLIGCANVANLLLAKATGRTREIAIRAAVGASRARIVRQLITESAVLAMIGGAAGLLLARWGSAALVALAPGNIPRLAETGIDGWVLAFTLGLAMAASLLFGLAPALQVSRVDLNDALKQGGSRVAGSGGRLRAVLVVAEVALSVVLLSGAGLLIRSFVALQNAPLGFRPEQVLVMQSSLPSSDMAGARRATRFYKDLLADLAAVPGASSVAGTCNPPGDECSDGGYFVDHMGKWAGGMPQAVFSVVTPDAFATLGIPLKRGRDFNESDGYDAPRTAIINEAMARQSFPGQDPLGHTLICGMDMESMKPMRIVGIVGDIRQYGPASPPRPEIIMPYEQHPQKATDLNILVRSAAGSGLQGSIERKVRARSGEVPVKFTSMAELLAQNVAAPRFRTLLLALFAGIAVCLAMAGVYGVMAYAVGQRAGEIGLRMALGASTGNVLRLVLRQGLRLTGIGLAIGLLAAVAATRLVSSMLFEVKPGDPLTYLGVAVLLGLVSLAASYIPARRAARVDPMSALRQE